MYAIVFSALAKPGNRQELVDFLQWDCAVANDKEPGTLRFDVIAEPESDVIYVYEAYKDHAAFEEHTKNEPYQKWKSDIEPNLKEFRKLFEGEPICFVNARNRGFVCGWLRRGLRRYRNRY